MRLLRVRAPVRLGARTGKAVGMVSPAADGDSIVSWVLVRRALVGFATDGFVLGAMPSNPKIKAGKVEGAFAATVKSYNLRYLDMKERG